MLLFPAGFLSAISDFTTITDHPTLYTSLLGYYKADEGLTTDSLVDAHASLDIIDFTGAGVGDAGVLIDCRTWTADAWFRNDNVAFDFAGNTDFSFVVNVQISDKTVDRTILAKWKTQFGNEIAYKLKYDTSSDEFQFEVSGDNSAITTVPASSFGSPTVDTWYQIVCGHDAANDIIFIQVDAGTRDTAAHSTGIYDTPGIYFTVGCYQNGVASGGYDFWRGKIDEMGVWSAYVVSESEATDLYSSGSILPYD